MSIVDDLLANPGLYLGVDRPVERDTVGSARIEVKPLPGGAGVSLDYEIFNSDRPEQIRGHVEHTLIARAHGGGNVMVIADIHAGGLVVLRETEPGERDLAELHLAK